MARIVKTIFSIIVISRAICAPRVAITADPPKAELKPGTAAKYMHDLLAYKCRAADAYDAHTMDPPEIRAAAHDLILASQRMRMKDIPVVGTSDSLRSEAKRLIKLGSQDPLILLIAGTINPSVAYEKQMVDLLHRGAQALEKSTYGPRERADFLLREYRARESVANKMGRSNSDLPPLDPIMHALVKWFAAEGNAKDDQRYIWGLV